MASFMPQRQLREVAPLPEEAALLMIDIQNYNCHREGALYQACSQEELEGPEYSYWWSRLDDCLPRWQLLLQAARGSSIEVIHAVIQQLTLDGRDRSLDYKISGYNVPPDCWDAQVLAGVEPVGDEIVLPKTSSSVFNSTNLHYLLKNMDRKYLIVAGCATDQCVAQAVMDAADLGYLVTLVTDCCATYSEERNTSACRQVAGYCRQRTVQQLVHELQQMHQ